LPFALCLSTVGPPPNCKLTEDLSIARGNVVLVDHGKTVGKTVKDESGESHWVPDLPTDVWCEGEGLLRATVGRQDHYRLQLKEGPLSFAEPLRPGIPASSTLKQDPRLAKGQITELKGTHDTHFQGSDTLWTVQRDLIGSGDEDRHFMVEIDNNRRAWLRFGDGDLGRAPEPGTKFEATYRVGDGASGNVGAEAISRLFSRSGSVSGVRVRNPLPAQGGAAPETLDEAKLLAPHAFRNELRRAVTAEDYGDLASKYPGVHRAVATLRWTGSWREVMVAIDPLGKAEAEEPLLRKVEEYLLPYRRMGHDVRVSGAEYVPLCLELEVYVLPNFLRGHVEAALLDVLSNRVLSDGNRGLFHPDNLSFGDPVRLSRIVSKAQSVTGVESITVRKFERLYEESNREIETGVLALGPLEIARLDNDPNLRENGLLRLEMRGGR
jgi:predicted phage baseplate assembly protein